MRRRLVVSTIAIVLVVMGALAVPVGVIVHRSAEDEVRARLEQQAGLIGSGLAPALLEGEIPTPAEVSGVLGPDDGVRITDAGGDVIVERVPPLTRPLSITRSGPGGTRIQVLTSTDELDDRFRRQLYILLALAGGGLLAAAALAAVQARQLARPLERLAASAARLGDGDFSRRQLPDTGIAEIDGIASALQSSSERIDTMLSNERHFTADATHQLRTGLTGIAMRFELLARHERPDVVDEADAGLEQTAQLDATISELLAVARQRSSAARTAFALDDLVARHVEEWTPRFAAVKRRLVLRSGAPVEVMGTMGLAGQVVDVVLDNALVHGRGTVTVTVEGPAVTVEDKGGGFADDVLAGAFDLPDDPAAPHGRGLGIARRLAQVDGGTLDIVDPRHARLRYRLQRASTG